MAAGSLVAMGADSEAFPALGFIPSLGEIASRGVRWGERLASRWGEKKPLLLALFTFLHLCAGIRWGR